ncbi:MAG TPA: helix-turn-helix transcriptional regulator [Gammaproteobacteria bacterium]|nr:helix-turn-helix transcriptional regulator [Gammaproteobacteria bacterium]
MLGLDSLVNASVDPSDLQALQDCLSAIYGAVLDPSQWLAVMSGLAPFLLAESVHLLCLKSARQRSEGASSYIPDAKQLRNHRMSRVHAAFVERLLRCPPLRIVSTETLACATQGRLAQPASERNSEPIGCVYMAGTHFSIADDGFALFCLHRGYRDGFIRSEQAARLALLAPHIWQALRLSERLQRFETRLAVKALVLDRCRIAAVTCDSTGRVIEINERAERLLGVHSGVLCIRGTRIRAMNARSDRALKQWIRDPGGRESPFASPVLCLTSPRGEASLECTVLVYTSDGRPPLPSRDLRLLLLRQYGETVEIDPRCLKVRLGLTTTQAEVLARLAMGATLAEIAVARGITLETIRTYVKALSRKLDCHNQAQLVAKALATCVLIA